MKKTVRLSKNPEESLSGTEKTPRDPEVGTLHLMPFRENLHK